MRIYLNGGTIIGSATPHFAFEAIPLTQPLKVGDKLTATQSVNGLVSVPSFPATIVGSLPATLPIPVVDKHIYACGHIVPVGNLLPGVTVSVNDQSNGGAAIGNPGTNAARVRNVAHGEDTRQVDSRQRWPDRRRAR